MMGRYLGSKKQGFIDPFRPIIRIVCILCRAYCFTRLYKLQINTGSCQSMELKRGRDTPG